MLQAIGARSIDDLFSPIPAEYRLERGLKVPRQMAESEIVEWFRERSRENGEAATPAFLALALIRTTGRSSSTR